MPSPVRCAVGYNGSDVRFVGPEEVAWVCGNTLLIQSTVTSRQRFLRGTSFGIQCFAVNAKQGFIAVAEKGPNPCIRVYSAATLLQLALVDLKIELGYSALAFSTSGEQLVICGEEPDCAVVVVKWQQDETVVRGKLPVAAEQVSFHPADSEVLCTTGGGHQAVWRIERLWDKFEFVPHTVTIAHQEPTCHVWAPQGLYSGMASGQVYAINADTLQPMLAVAERTMEQRWAARAALAVASDGGGTAAAASVAAVSPDDQASITGSGLGSERPSQLASAQSSAAPGVPVCFQAANSPIVSMALNRDVVLVGSSDLAAKLISHGRPMAPFELRHEQPFSALGIASLEFGGDEFDHVVVGARDGTVWLAHLRHDMCGVLSCTVICDSHLGPVTGVAPHPVEPWLATTGSDGGLRLWDAASGALVSKRTFSSAQSCLAVARSKPLVALGSELGVVRLVSLLDGLRPLPVLFRRRLHSAAVTSLVFSPASSMLASAGKDGTLWFVAMPQYGGEATVLGHVVAPEPILAMAWPAVVDAEDCVLVSLVSGGIMCVTSPTCRVRRPGMAEGAEGGAASIVAAPSADVQLGTRENVTIKVPPKSDKVLKIEVPLLRMVSVPGERYGELYGLGADKLMHRVVLPTEGQAWAGLKGRLHKSLLKVPVHSMPGGAISVCATGMLVASGGADGCVSTCNPSLIEVGNPAGGVGLHDTLAGGVLALSFDSTGRYFMSAGADGCLFVFETRGTTHVSRPPPLVPGLPADEDNDFYDDSSELTQIEVAQRQNIQDALAAVADEREGVAKRLAVLRQQLLEAVHQNEVAPDLEQADRSDFIIDAELVSQLKAAAAARVAGVREVIKWQHLRLDLIAERIKHTCWDQMQKKGLLITAMRQPLEVANFATANYDDSLLRKAAFLRCVEVAEHKQLGVVDGGRQYRVTLDGQGLPLNSAPGARGPEEGHDEDVPVAPGAGGAQAVSAASMAAHTASFANAEVSGFEAGMDDVAGTMYSDFDLITASRKAMQIHFFRHHAHVVKMKFNEEFGKVAKQKKADADHIADLNGRIDEALHDLHKLGGSWPPLDQAQGAHRFKPQFPEEMDNVLRVKDAEVSLAQYVSEEERSRGEATRRAEEDGMRKTARDNALDRAIRQMMGGTLTGGRAEEPDPFKLERPEWMDGNPKLFTEEQTKTFKEWVLRDKGLQEDKAKRINMLQMELRTMAAATEDIGTRFDEALAALAARRLKASAAVAAYESRILSMATSIDQCCLTGDKAERDIYARLNALKERKARVSSDLSEKRAVALALAERAALLQADEKQLDRNFKKEFLDCEGHGARLLQLYRHRVVPGSGTDAAHAGSAGPSPAPGPASSRSPGAPPGGDGDPGTPSARPGPQLLRSNSDRAAWNDAAPAAMPAGQPAPHSPHPFPPLPATPPSAALDPFPEQPPKGSTEEVELLDLSMRPEGLDMAWWDKLVSYRANKVRDEVELHTSAVSLAVLRKELPMLEVEDVALDKDLAAALDQLNALKAGRSAALYDVDMQLKLKAGQVETAPQGLVSSDNETAVFLHRRAVEATNAQVLSKGGKKVEILTAIKDFKKGIYDLEFEHKKFDMLIQDLKDKTRELQLLHVTRDIQTVFKEGEDRSNAQEAANLEVLGRQREKLQDKAILDKQRKLKKIGGDIQSKAARNSEVAAHLMTLHKVLDEQQRLQLSMHSLDDVAARRMRSLVTHKKLAEISAAQRSELAALASELDALRLRSYPTFAEPQVAMAGHRAITPPDLKKLPPLGSTRV